MYGLATRSIEIMVALSGKTGTSGSNAVGRIKELEKPLNIAMWSISLAISAVTSSTSCDAIAVYFSSRFPTDSFIV